MFHQKLEVAINLTNFGLIACQVINWYVSDEQCQYWETELAILLFIGVH
jgi:hypothetical protein